MARPVLLIALALLALTSALAASTAFTYQGRLMDGAAPANGVYDLRFALYDAPTGGVQVGPLVTREDVPVAQSAFVVLLDFGTAPFVGGDRWLDIGVRPGDQTGAFTPLTPRQAVTPTPVALYAQIAGTVPEYGLPGAVVLNNRSATMYGSLHFSPLHLTAPFTVADNRTGMVTNLNAEFVGGKRAADLAPAGHGHTFGDIAGSIGEGALPASVSRLDLAQTLTSLKTFAPATGTAPFAVSAGKTGLVANLNSEFVGGKRAAEFADAAHTHGYAAITGTVGTAALPTTVVYADTTQTITGRKAFAPDTGTVPFTVAAGKSGLVLNLNAEFVGGKRAADLATATHTHDAATLTGTLNAGTLPASAARLDIAQTFTGVSTFLPVIGNTPFIVGAGMTGTVNRLNADMLDGQHAADFAAAGHTHAGEHWTGGGGLAVTSKVAGGYGISGAGDGGVAGSTPSATGRAVMGTATSTAAGTNYGGHFSAAGTAGHGVYGEATATGEVVNYGGHFSASGDGGHGVHGVAAATGPVINYGGHFRAGGRYGRGIYAEASGTGAYTNYGGYFKSSGGVGQGVHGEASATGSYTNYGGFFTAAGNTGRGLYAEASATGAYTNYGGWFMASGNTGIGVRGEAGATGAIQNTGGYFTAGGSSGRGLYAEATATGAVSNFGGRFRASGDTGTGVLGEAPSTAATTNYGGRFFASGTTGRGLYAEASNTTGTNYGGKFLAKGATGAGVYGEADNTAAGAVNYGGRFVVHGASAIGAKASNAASATAASLAGPDYAVKAEGDLVVTGAIRGTSGPNGGALFPRPAYDSGWVRTEPNTYGEWNLPTSLGSDAGNLYVLVQWRNSEGSIGNWFWHRSDWPTVEYRGLRWQIEPGTPLRFFYRRMPGDDYFVHTRVRIWLIS